MITKKLVDKTEDVVLNTITNLKFDKVLLEEDLTHMKMCVEHLTTKINILLAAGQPGPDLTGAHRLRDVLRAKITELEASLTTTKNTLIEKLLEKYKAEFGRNDRDWKI